MIQKYKIVDKKTQEIVSTFQIDTDMNHSPVSEDSQASALFDFFVSRAYEQCAGPNGYQLLTESDNERWFILTETK